MLVKIFEMSSHSGSETFEKEINDFLSSEEFEKKYRINHVTHAMAHVGNGRHGGVTETQIAIWYFQVTV